MHNYNHYPLPSGYSTLCALLLNDEREILHGVFTKFCVLFNASAVHAPMYIAIAKYVRVCIIHGRTRTRMVIAARTLDVSSGLQLHGVVGNKYVYIIQ